MGLSDEDVGSTLDYLGRSQPLTRPRLALTTSGGGGPVTAPVTPTPLGGPTPSSSGGPAGVTPPGLGGDDRALALARQALGLGSTGISLAQRMMSPSGVSFADQAATEAGRVTPESGQTGAVGGPVAGSEGLEGATSVPGETAPGTFTGSATLGAVGGALGLVTGIAQGDPVTAARGATSVAGTAGREVGGAAGSAIGQTASYLGAALNIIQDAISGKKPVSQQALDAAIDVAAAVLAAPSAGISEAAAPLVKADIGNIYGIANKPGVTPSEALGEIALYSAGTPFTSIMSMFGFNPIADLFGSSKNWLSFGGRVAGNMTQTAQHVQEGYQRIAGAQSLEELGAAIDAYNQNVGFPGALGRPTQVGPYTLMDVSGRDWPGGKIHGKHFPSTEGAFGQASQALTQLIQQKSAEFEQKNAMQDLLDRARALGPRASALMPAGPAGALGFSSDVLQTA